MRKRLYLTTAALVVMTALLFISCGSYEESGTVIIDGKEAAKLVGTSGVVLVDAQTASNYAKEHIDGAVNIQRNDIVKKDLVVNMLADASTIEAVFGSRGISNSTQVVIYDDNNNMDAARLWWTFLVYGHENVKVVSGGLQEMVRAGFAVSTTPATASPATFKAAAKNTALIATTAEVLAQVNDPKDDVFLIDTRTDEEFDAGTIPSSIHLNYVGNDYADGTFRKIQDIRIIYKEAGVRTDDTAIMYCKTSIRGAQTFLALYNAGYRNLKLYDGAWLEWILDGSRPIQLPVEKENVSIVQDAS